MPDQCEDREHLDLLLKWKDAPPSSTDGEEDTVSLEIEASAPEAEQAEPTGGLEQGEPTGGIEQAETTAGADVKSSEETFEWTEDRIRAIEEAFQLSQEVPFTAVYHQLSAIHGALAREEPGSEIALHLLDEVRRYIEARLSSRQAPLTSDPSFEAIRDRVRDGLNLLLEASVTLRDYLKEPTPLKLDIAARLSDEGNGFLLEALREMTALRESPAPSPDAGEQSC